jgi:hypothetical protein
MAPAELREAGPPKVGQFPPKTGQLETMLTSMQDLVKKSKGLKQDNLEGKEEVTPSKGTKPQLERSALKRPAAACTSTFDWLPKHFKAEKKVRLSGNGAGEPYFLFVAPCGRKLRSRREVDEYVVS